MKHTRNANSSTYSTLGVFYFLLSISRVIFKCYVFFSHKYEGFLVINRF